MKKSRRRAGWLVGLMVAVSLMMAPRGGAASGPFRWPEPGPPNEGDPDEPASHTGPWFRGLQLEWKNSVGRIERGIRGGHSLRIRVSGRNQPNVRAHREGNRR